MQPAHCRGAIFSLLRGLYTVSNNKKKKKKDVLVIEYGVHANVQKGDGVPLGWFMDALGVLCGESYKMEDKCRSSFSSQLC